MTHQEPALLVGLAGAAKSGKDTIADYLVSHHGFVKIGFADPIRAQIADAWALDNTRLLEDQRVKDLPTNKLTVAKCKDDGFINWFNDTQPDAPDHYTDQSPRQIQQLWGDYKRASCGWDYFINLVTENIAEIRAANPAARIVVSGVRYAASAPYPEAEAIMIRTSGGMIWHIQRPNLKAAHGHSTERKLPTMRGDVTLWNSADLIWLRHQTRNFVSSMIWLIEHAEQQKSKHQRAEVTHE